MKKILTIILLFASLYLFTGCNKLNNNISPNEGVPSKGENTSYFWATIEESHKSHLIVRPQDIKTFSYASKFFVHLEENADKYKVGSSVKITYNGIIKETNPPQISALKVDNVSDFKILFHGNYNLPPKQIISKETNNDYDYNVYVYNGTIDITINNETYSLEEALNKNKITMNEIVAKAIEDFPDNVSYDDGGSQEYHYKDYTIIKMHKLSGNEDVYIGDKDFNINKIRH